MNRPVVPLRDAGVSLVPDPDRVIARLFVPGREDVGPGDSRADPVIERVLGLDPASVTDALRELEERFADDFDSLAAAFDRHAEQVMSRIDRADALGADHRRLLGATFTHHYAIEGAALCNPSIVRHPEQPADGSVAFVLSVRGVGEGHISSIGFRTGSVATSGAVAIDPPAPQPHVGAIGPGVNHRSVMHRRMADLGDDHENAAFVLDALPDEFDTPELDAGIAALGADKATRRHTSTTIANLRHLARAPYTVTFDTADVSAHVLWPHAPGEVHGMEDARFVEITDGSAPRYCATYTAFDGSAITQSLLTTDDFVRFTSSPMGGAAARGKGLALFPRRIRGRHVALSRADRETNSVAWSDDLRVWDESRTIQSPVGAWEMVQLGNCGSPIETADGWLVLTHGVGPMRTYSIGALLLDLEEPEHVLARTHAPLVTPGRDRRGGYVPNVVYTCGALAVGDLLVLPYGVGDRTISVATLSIDQLIASMTPSGASPGNGMPT